MERIRVWLVAAMLAFGFQGAWADEAAKAQEVVDDAKSVFAEFVADPEMKWFRDNVKRARGLLIVPYHGKAGFILGGSGGSGLLLGRDPSSGKWSQPAFYTMGAASIGLQIGAQSSKIILMVMTKNGLDNLVDGKAQLGANASVAAGPVGVGAEAATADVLACARRKGAFGGVSAEGAVISPNNDRNTAYYGKTVNSTDIIVRRNVSNPKAQPLIDAVAKHVGG
jgi:lipid-binding SYLF domain-containing protein